MDFKQWVFNPSTWASGCDFDEKDLKEIYECSFRNRDGGIISALLNNNWKNDAAKLKFLQHRANKWAIKRINYKEEINELIEEEEDDNNE